jgi:hypothetical protein
VPAPKPLLVPPPLYELENGPAAGRFPVFADINGELPRFVVVTEYRGPDTPPREHVYKQLSTLAQRILSLAATRYIYIRTIDSQQGPRITCPRCGRTSYHPTDVEQGYCGHCHDWTRINRYAVVHPTPGVELPAALAGRWFERSSVDSLLAMSRLVGRPTGMYVRGAAGAHAEVFEARHSSPPGQPELHAT